MPPFVGTAVNVTLVPAQIVVDGLALINILAVTFGVTVKTAAKEVTAPPPHEPLRTHLY